MISCFRRSGIRPAFLIALLISSIHFLFPAALQARAVLYDGRNGLNSNDVKCISKDNRGLIWIGTFYGLNIFDGYTFSKFQGTLSDKYITRLKNNPNKNELWVGTSNGIFRIKLHDFTTNKFNYLGNAKSAYSNLQIHAICLNGNEVYFSFGRGLIGKVTDKENFKLVCRLPDSASAVSDLAVYDNDHLIANNGALQLIDIRTGKYETLKVFDKPASVRSLMRKGDSLIFCDDISDVYIVHIKDIKAKRNTSAPFKKTYRLPYKPITAFLNGNKLYCLSENYSFTAIDLSTDSMDNISLKYPDIFEGKAFYSLFMDENAISWICTNKGIIKVEERSISFGKELSNIPERVSTRDIYQCSNGDMYVCSYAGLWYLPHGSGSWERYGTQSSVNIKNLLTPGGYLQPISLLPAPGGDFFYVGTDNHGILKYDLKKRIFEELKIRMEDTARVLGSVSDMATDKHGKVWLATLDGLAIYDTRKNSIGFPQKNKFDIGRIRVRQLYRDKAGDKMYAATANGLFVLDVDKGVVKHYTTSSVPAISNDDVYFVSMDNKDNIWIGTNGGGINLIEPGRKAIKYIRRIDGLSSEVVYSMIQENDNIFWFGTFNGLDRYQKDRNSFTNFFEDDGLSSNEFNHNSFLKTDENQFYFGSINGITTFRPHQFVKQVPFHIYFAGISKWDDKSQSVRLFLQDLKTGSDIEKGPSEQLVELHFGCSDYSDPQRNAYSYRIREISDNWISLEERHSLNIGGLPYGRFTLEVKATNARGGASSNILYYNLHILQPFYRTWWFFALILLVVGLIFYGAYLLKYQSFKRILHLRMKIASNLHDEVGSLLTRITMFPKI